MEKTSIKLAFMVIILVMAFGMPFSIVSTEVKGGVDPMAPCNSDKDCKPKCPGCKSANCSNHRCICACEP
ncbi:hypothetical protein MRB53_002360 [Persea americana]|uniref:Uncharacterized protein n=1 Tax=Persea americana TaxID=3435 RepID=A0ACC2MWN1_PERAE|nr:hypothetical protein MRB53_002360 [Persea americana]